MTAFTQNTAATHGQQMSGNDPFGTDAPNGDGTVPCYPGSGLVRSGLIQKGDSDLIGVAPNQLCSQLQTLLAHQQIEPSWKNCCATNCQSSAISGHVADQAIDDAVAGIKGNLCAQVCSSAVRFPTFNRHGRSQSGTSLAVYNSLSNARAEVAPADALDIAGAA